MENIRFGSVCSGIEAASVAWAPLGWKAAWFSEFEPFPCAVLAHHYQDVPNLGDMSKLPERVLSGEIEAPDVFCGGTPCQAFSVAGLRRSLDDARGNLSLVFCEIADAIDAVRHASGYQPAIIFWENVPGVLSTSDNAFGCFLAGLAGEDDPLEPPGGKWTNAGYVLGPKRAVAWRVLDAQYFGVAQRRRRVFVVASARDGLNPAEILFEFEGLRRDSPPSREARESVTYDTAPCLTSSGRGVARTGETRGQDPVVAMAFGGGNTSGPIDPAACLTARGMRIDFEVETFVVHGTQDPCVMNDQAFALGRNAGQENVLAFSCKDYGADAAPLSPTLRAMGHGESHANAGGQVAVCITGDITHTLKAEGFDASEDGTGRGQSIVAYFANAGHFGSMQEVNCSDPLRAKGGDTGNGGETLALQGMAVRRLTPLECERLQGFPDGHTDVPHKGKPAADGPRYKALGNSWAVPNVRWIGSRIQAAIYGLQIGEIDAKSTA